jgi:beta-fructofuranosidase
MHQLYYQPRGYWFGDCMPFYHAGKFYLFHQRDTRKPIPLFSEPFGWSLARTTDFVHYEDLGEALKHGGDDNQDQYVWAGSLFETKGVFYALYTGYNHEFAAQGKDPQVLMIATSHDLIHWHKTSEKLVVPQPGYDPKEWRDPYIFWNEDAQEYVMILGARKLDGKKIRTGRTVWFTSTDLKNWAFHGDFWAPELFYMHEMPDIFKIGEYWYLLTTEYSKESKTIYRMSKSLSGPWTAPLDDAFDGRAYYAARSCSDGDRRYLFGWVPTKENEDDLSNWQWGGTLVVHEVYQRADGSLGVKIPETVHNFFQHKERLASSPIVLEAVDSCVEAYLTKTTGDLFKFTAKARFTYGTRSFGIRVCNNPTTGDSYEFVFQVSANRLSFERTPNLPWHRLMREGLERPLQLEAERDYTIQIIVDDTIATIYVDGVALNTRLYAKAGQALAVYVVDGRLTIQDPIVEGGL